MKDGELDSARVMKVINHPVRLRVIELLASKGPLSWKELSNELGVKTGSLYHHLDTLENIVARDAERRYVLTKKGMDLYNYLEQNPSRPPRNLEKVIKGRTSIAVLKDIFIPRSLIFQMSSTRTRGILSLVILSGVVVGTLALSGNELILFSFSSVNDILVEAGAFILSMAALSAIGFASIRVFFGEKSDPLVLLSSSALSFVPIVAFGGLLQYLEGLGSTGFLADRTTLTILVAFFQAWGAGIAAAGMSVSSGLRIEKTLMVSLIILYATMMVVFLNGGRLA
jgi:DNA-binding HxlR family transcriptional regulator